ncbi:uncharacterized protein LOC141680409 [Apium graveolens]|uniref:uncharacterized protein LOC141680409 n=1 Tax=Apium graveolens TaxID=4045 RepID=UPI003D7A0618
MGTEVLRSHDCIRKAPATFNHRKNYHGNGNTVLKFYRKQVRPERRRNLPDPKKPEARFVLQDTYAGSACSMSPAPSSLPLPSFCVKAVDELAATRDLRRLLRLD